MAGAPDLVPEVDTTPHAAASYEKAFAAEKHVAIVRGLVIAFNVSIYIFLMDKTESIVPLASAICVVASGYATLVLVYQPYRKFPVLRSAWFSAVTDASLIVLWVWATGSFESPFYLLWYLSLAAVAFRFSAQTTAIVAVVYAALYVALLAATGELLPHLVDVSVRIMYIFLIGLLVGYQARETFQQTHAKIQMRDLMLETKVAEERLLESDQELRRSVSLLNATLESTTDGILVVGSDNRIASYNKKFAEMWHLPADVIAEGNDEKAIAFILDQLKTPDDFVAKIQQLYENPLSSSFDVLEFKDGRIFERYSLPQMLEARPVGRVWSFRDVTERRRVEKEKLSNMEREKEVERLRELDRFKTQFVNSVAHELWTPLTPIQLQLHMLQKARGASLTEDQRRSVDVIARNMERLRHLVEELLDGARLQAGRFRVHRVPMNLHTVVTEMVDLFQVPAETAGIKLTSELDPDLPIEGDSNRLIQVLYNLLSNALKFTPRGGSVHVESRLDGATARVSVHDTGVGLTSEQRDRLFQAFSQVHDTMQQTRAGTGLGLYISRAIVEAHNGLLTAYSEGAGRGSTFEVSLPLYRTEPPNVPHGTMTPHAPSHHA